MSRALTRTCGPFYVNCQVSLWEKSSAHHIYNLNTFSWIRQKEVVMTLGCPITNRYYPPVSCWCTSFSKFVGGSASSTHESPTFWVFTNLGSLGWLLILKTALGLGLLLTLYFGLSCSICLCQTGPFGQTLTDMYSTHSWTMNIRDNCRHAPGSLVPLWSLLQSIAWSSYFDWCGNLNAIFSPFFETLWLL